MQSINKVKKFLLFLWLICSISLLNPIIWDLGKKSDTKILTNQTKKDPNSLNSAGLALICEWSRTWDRGGSPTNDDRGKAVAVDSSGNIYVGGRAYGSSFEENFDICLLKFNPTGNLEWSRIWEIDGQDEGEDIAIDTSNNIYITGYNSTNTLLAKYDNLGNELWKCTWTGGICQSITTDSLNNVYLTGYRPIAGKGSDIFLVKFNSSGKVEWEQIWGGSNYECGYGITSDPENNLYIAGETFDPELSVGKNDMLLVKYNSSGTEQWNLTWGGIEGEFGIDVAIDSSFNIFLTGKQDSFTPSGCCVVKYNSTRTQLWNFTESGSEIGSFEHVPIVMDSSDNFFLTGGLGKIGLAKYSNSGVKLYETIWDGHDIEHGEAIDIDSSGNIYVAGWNELFGGSDILLVKFKLSEIGDDDDDNDDKKEQKAIPGYNIPIILGLLSTISVTSTIFYKKKYQYKINIYTYSFA